MGKKKIEAGRAGVRLGVNDRLKKGLALARRRLRAFAAGTAKIGSALNAVGATTLGGFVFPIKKAAEFQETVSKFNTVFGDNAKQVKTWGDEFAGQVGRSKTEITGFLASTQDLLVPLGIDPAIAEETTKQITKLGVDLASFNNKADSDAINDIQAALTGSGEVMKKYGVIVNQTAVNQELLNKGLNPKNATEAQKALARLAIITKGTTAAQGDAIRTSGSFTNRMKALKASISDAAVSAGTPFLDFLAGLTGKTTSAIRAVSGIIEKNPQLVKGLAIAGSAVFGAGVGLTTLAGIVFVASTAIGGLVTIGGLLTATLGAILSPIGLISIAIGAGAVAFFNYSKAGKETVDFVSKGFFSLLDNVKKITGGIFDALVGGDLALAGEIAFKGLKLAGVSAAKSLLSIFGVSTEQISKLIAATFKQVSQLAAKVNSIRQQAVNALAKAGTGVVNAFRAEDNQIDIGVENRFATERANAFQKRVDSIDVDAVAKAFEDSLDTDLLKSEIDTLISRAKALRKEAEETVDLINDPKKLDPPLELPDVGAQARRASAAIGSLSVADLNRVAPRNFDQDIARNTAETSKRMKKLIEIIPSLAATYS